MIRCEYGATDAEVCGRPADYFITVTCSHWDGGGPCCPEHVASFRSGLERCDYGDVVDVVQIETLKAVSR